MRWQDKDEQVAPQLNAQPIEVDTAINDKL